MTDFTLIKQIANKKPDTAPELPPGIVYETLDVQTFDAGVMKVHLPKSTAQAFIDSVNEQTVLCKSDVRELLREFRGINGN